MEPRDWLLLLLARCPKPEGLDPVRLQKGAFLLAEEAGLPPSQRYRFVPYNYGPMSADVYRDVEQLLTAGLIERLPMPGYSWARYRATAAGTDRADALTARLGSGERGVRELTRIAAEITAVGFDALLSDVYERYPRYAARSVFRRPDPGRGRR